MAPYTVANDGNALQVRLTYSNAALLEKMNVHVVEPVAEDAVATPGEESATAHDQNPFGTFQLTDDGAFLKPYEQLISPEPVPSLPLHWPWNVALVSSAPTTSVP